MSKLVYGSFEWVCPQCNKYFHKSTKQGLGMAKSNHNRVHKKKGGDV